MSLEVPLSGIERVMDQTCADLEVFTDKLESLRVTTTKLARFNANFRTFLGSMEVVTSCNAFADIDALTEARHIAEAAAHNAAREAALRRIEDINAALAALAAPANQDNTSNASGSSATANGQQGRFVRGLRGVGGAAAQQLPAIAAHFDLAKLPPKFQSDAAARDALFRLYEGILAATRAAKAAPAPGAAATSGAAPGGVTVAGAVALTRGTTIFTNECLSCLTRLGMVARTEAASAGTVAGKKTAKAVVFIYVAVERSGVAGGAGAEGGKGGARRRLPTAGTVGKR